MTSRIGDTSNQPHVLPPASVETRGYQVCDANLETQSEQIVSLWKFGLSAKHTKLKWYYFCNIESTPDVFFLVANAQSKIVGVGSTGKRSMRLGNECISTGITIDFVIHPDHRSLFPALALQRAIRNQSISKYFIVWGLPNPAATAIFNRAGYKCIGYMGRYVRVVRSEKYLSIYLPKWLAHVAAKLVDASLLALNAARTLRTRPYQTAWQATADARFSSLWERTAQQKQLIGVRNADFLNWRFAQFPFGKHNFFTLISPLDSRLVGYAACEIVDDNLNVSDFLVDPFIPDAFQALWQSLAREAMNASCSTLSTRFFGNEVVKKHLCDAGLMLREKSPVYATARDDSRTLLDANWWYLTRADIDT